jgi:fructokinase
MPDVAPTIALVIGESLVDVVHGSDGSRVEFPGGSAANVAVALARLGREVRFATSFGDDERGQLLADRLTQDGVALASDPYAIARTSTAEATIGSDGAAAYTFDLAWRLNPIDPGLVPAFVHTCSIGAVLMPGASTVVEQARRLREHALVTYDVNMRPAVTGAGPEVLDRVCALAAASDLVKASDEDLAVLFPGVDMLTAAKELLALGPAAVVVTRGGEGATWVGAGQEIDVAAVPVPVADTIGAGDTFCAAVIDGLWSHGLAGAAARERLLLAPRDIVVEVLAHAARAASVTVGRPGADPPYRRELA